MLAIETEAITIACYFLKIRVRPRRNRSAPPFEKGEQRARSGFDVKLLRPVDEQ